MKSHPLVLLTLCAGLHSAFAAEPAAPSPLAGIDALRGEFPISLRFRAERFDNGSGKHAPPLELTQATFATETDGALEKMLHDIGRYSPEGHQKLAEKLPAKLFIEHLLFPAVSREFAADFGGDWPFSPCHFVYHEGCLAAENRLPDAKTLKVADGKKFRHGDCVVLVPMSHGKRLWASSEFASVTAVEGGVLHLQRAVYETKPLDPKGTTFDALWVAPLQKDFSEDAKTKTHFQWNFSTLCPRDEKGRNAVEAFAGAISRLFASDGALSRIHGLAWDVPMVSFRRKGGDGRPVDADMDGKGDDGFKDGVNTYAIGAVELHRRVRAAIGENRIFLSDGFYGDDEDPRLQLPGVFNGIEHDVNNDHRLMELSSLLNVTTFYQQHVQRPLLNLLVRKDGKVDRKKGGPDAASLRQNQCMKNAMATLLGMAYNDISFDRVEEAKAFSAADESQCGKDDRLHWLGKPTSALIRPALAAPDLLQGTGVKVTDAFLNRWKSADATLRRDRDQMLIQARKQPAYVPPDRDPLTFTLPNIALKKDRSLLVQFDVRSEKLRDFAADVPRIITVTPEGLSDWPAKKKQTRALLGWSTSAAFTTVSFYFREATEDSRVTLHFGIQGRQDVIIRNFTLRETTEVFARAYEHGVVLCNPNERTPWTVDLKKLFPGMPLRRIAGSAYDEQMAKENTGEPIREPVTIKPKTGLFLVKMPQ